MNAINSDIYVQENLLENQEVVGLIFMETVKIYGKIDSTAYSTLYMYYPIWLCEDNKVFSYNLPEIQNSPIKHHQQKVASYLEGNKMWIQF